jgi:hypothetical protein
VCSGSLPFFLEIQGEATNQFLVDANGVVFFERAIPVYSSLAELVAQDIQFLAAEFGANNGAFGVGTTTAADIDLFLRSRYSANDGPVGLARSNGEDINKVVGVRTCPFVTLTYICGADEQDFVNRNRADLARYSGTTVINPGENPFPGNARIVFTTEGDGVFAELLTSSFSSDTQFGYNINGVSSIGRDVGQIIGVRIAAVPEPTTWMTMLLGFAAVGWSMRRRGAGSSNSDRAARAS